MISILICYLDKSVQVNCFKITFSHDIYTFLVVIKMDSFIMNIRNDRCSGLSSSLASGCKTPTLFPKIYLELYDVIPASLMSQIYVLLFFTVINFMIEWISCRTLSFK